MSDVLHVFLMLLLVPKYGFECHRVSFIWDLHSDMTFFCLNPHTFDLRLYLVCLK